MMGLTAHTPMSDTLSLSHFTIDTVALLSGDLVAMLDIKKQEWSPILLPVFEPHGVRTAETSDVSADTSGPDPMVERYRNPHKQRKILIFRDSFCDGMIPFLKETFGETVLIRGVHFDTTMIRTEQPDLVVTEVVERNLDMLARPIQNVGPVSNTHHVQ